MGDVLHDVKGTFYRHGWPRPTDKHTRTVIAEMLGVSVNDKTPARKPVKKSTYCAWATRAAGAGEEIVAAAILSVYRYRDGRRRCGCLEFIVSRVRGLGFDLVQLARAYLVLENIGVMFSGADL